MRALLKLHRRAGVLSALFVILLSLTGLVLQHSARLALDQKFISSDTLLNWYGIEVPEAVAYFAIDSHSVTHIADRIYFDTNSLPGNFATPVGIVAIEFGYAVATTEGIVLLTGSGQVIEILTALHEVPAGILQIGIGPDARVYLRTPNGITRADFDEPFFLFQDLPPSGIVWSLPGEPGTAMLDSIRRDYAESLLSWERLLLDLHSGRLLGTWGVVLVDVMALLFIFMAITGLWIWTRRRS